MRARPPLGRRAGTLETTKAVYEQILDLRIATPQVGGWVQGREGGVGGGGEGEWVRGGKGRGGGL